MSIEQIDIGLQNYYRHKNADYMNEDGVGKFIEWIDENGYTIDAVKEELYALDASAASIVEFDDGFPTEKTKDDRIEEIFDVLLTCWMETGAFEQYSDIPSYPGIIWENSEYNKQESSRYDAYQQIKMPGIGQTTTWLHSAKLEISQPNIPTSIFKAKLDARRTQLLINGYSNNDTYFQIISTDIMAVIRLYFHDHIRYFNINAKTVKKRISGCPGSCDINIANLLSKYQSVHVESAPEFNKYHWMPPSEQKHMILGSDNENDSDDHLTFMEWIDRRPLMPIHVNDELKMLNTKFELQFLFDYQSNLRAIYIGLTEYYTVMKSIQNIVFRIRIICVETNKSISQLVNIQKNESYWNRCSVPIENVKQLGITPQNIQIREKGIDIGVEMEVLHVLYGDKSYWNKSSYSFVEDVIYESDMLYYDAWRRHFDSRCFKADDKYFYLLEESDENCSLPEFLQFIRQFPEEILSLPYDIIIIDGQKLRFSLKGRFRHGLMNALRVKRQMSHDCQLYSTFWNGKIMKTKRKSRIKQHNNYEKAHAYKRHKSYVNHKKKYKYNRW